MNKQFLTDMYDVVKADGYPDDFDTFVSTIQNDMDFQKELYDEVKSEGYPDAFDDFKLLIGTSPSAKTPVRTPEQIKADGEEAYQQMMRDIDTEYEKAYVEDNYGWVKNNPVANFGMSLASPSSMESIDAGKIPTGGDIFIDAGLNAASLFAAPERIAVGVGKHLPKLGKVLSPSTSRLKNIAVGALEQGAMASAKLGKVLSPSTSRLKNIAVGALEQGAMSGLEEGVLSTKHDRDYSLTAPLVGGIGGGLLGGTATTSMARKLTDGGFDKSEIAEIMQKLGTTEKGTLDALGKSGVESLDKLGTERVQIPVYRDDELLPVREWMEGKAYKNIHSKEALSPVRRSMDIIKKSPNLSLKSKEKTLFELKELEDTFYKKLIDKDEANRKLSDELFENETHARSLGLDVDEMKFSLLQPETSIPLAGYVKDIEETISNPEIRRRLIHDVAKVSGEEKALKGLMDKGKYENILEKTPEIIESGSILSTAKNIFNRAPHGTKTTRNVLRAPVVLGGRAKERVEKPKREVPKYINPSTYNSNGDRYYAPRGYITWEDLWADADKINKKQK